MATTAFPFLKLPLELRESIFSLYFKPADRLQHSQTLESRGFCGGVYRFEFGLCLVNKQIYQEAITVWRRENVFVKISTPWPSAGMYRVYLMATDSQDSFEYEAGGRMNHISSEGLVPIVCYDQASEKFSTHHSLVRITAPFHQAVPEHSVIVLLDDLHLFTQTWYYSALSYPMLNDRLSTSFVLRSPFAGQPVNMININVQRKLLLPFENVKGLHHVGVEGYAPEVKAELERRMAIPIPSLTQCVESATELMTQGDQALRDSSFMEALELYKKSFCAIHILIHGRTRRVLGDVFFQQGITTGRYAGQTGITVRIVLRLKLVSRYCLGYAKLEDWGEVAFWGMRSIHIMRGAMDTEFEDFISEFVGGEDVAMIYVRTGLAFWKMETENKEQDGIRHSSRWRTELAGYEGDDFARSSTLWGVAMKYSKNRDSSGIRRELASFDVPSSIVRAFGNSESSVDSTTAAT